MARADRPEALHVPRIPWIRISPGGPVIVGTVEVNNGHVYRHQVMGESEIESTYTIFKTRTMREPDGNALCIFSLAIMLTC